MEQADFYLSFAILHVIFSQMQTDPAPTARRLPIRFDWLVGALLFLAVLVVYLRTLAPSVAYIFDDSLEFQLLAARMAIAHPTGYPLYSILIKLFTLLPIGDVAFRVNLSSAIFGALAVVFGYATARRLTDRLILATDVWGDIVTRAPALVAALIFAFGATFWSQAVLAEVYALQALLLAVMLWLTLEWSRRQSAGTTTVPQHGFTFQVSLVTLSFFAGLMLTHHRTSILFFPALAIYVLCYNRTFYREPRTLLKMALAFALPVLLYLYLPVRGLSTSSLDGTYQNTFSGLINWILGTSYTVFLTQNPLNQTRDASYYFSLFLSELTPLGLILAGVGFVALILRAWREWLLLALGLAANFIFAVTYRVADVDVFFIPSFLFLALFAGVGAAWIVEELFLAAARRRTTKAMPLILTGALLIVFLLIPYRLFSEHYARVDLSNKWDVHDYGLDLLSQPLPSNATLIGILGEMSLVRYFQETQNLRPDVQTVAADKEDARREAIELALKNNRSVFLTRPLAGAEKKYALTSMGPLVRVQTKSNRDEAPSPANTLNADFGDAELVGYDLDLSQMNNGERWHIANGPKARVTLYWHADKKIPTDLLVSLKLLTADGKVGGQLDRKPVLDAYPTTAWHSGEYITDTYDLPVTAGALPGEYTLQVTLYDPESGKVYGQKDLTKVTLAPDTSDRPISEFDLQNTVVRDFGGVELIGYSMDAGEPYTPGDEIPIVLLWRINQLGAPKEFDYALSSADGKVVHSHSAIVGGDKFASGQFLRQETSLAVPSDASSGEYTARLSLRDALPGIDSALTLGTIEVAKK